MAVYLEYLADAYLYHGSIYIAGRRLTLFLAAVWLAGASMTFARFYWRDRGEVCRMRQSAQMQPDLQQRMQELVRQLAGEMGIRAEVSVRQIEGLFSPELGGFFRPIIYLPKEEFEEERLRCIFVHELTHYKCRDRWFRGLSLLYVCMYWFIPAARRLPAELQEWDEYHCDQKVCGSSLVTKAEYIRTLCRMTLEREGRKSTAGLCLGNDRSRIRERLHRLEKSDGPEGKLTWEPEIVIREGITVLLQTVFGMFVTGIVCNVILSLLSG